MDVQIVAVGSGTPVMAKAFAQEFDFTGELYVDQSRKVYDALKCKRGLKATLGIKSLGAYKNALSHGFKQGNTQGDGLQLGGTFVLKQGGEVAWLHQEQYAGDHASNEEILDALQALGEQG